MFAFGGAVMVQDVPEQVKAGKRVLAPIALPWVLETAMREEDTRVSKKRGKRGKGHTAHERDFHCAGRALEQVDVCDGELATVGPVGSVQCEGGLLEALGQVGRDVHLSPPS